MCGRFVMLTADEVADVVAAVERRASGLVLAGDAGARPQAYPGSRIPTIAFGPEGLSISEQTWGFSPEWSKRPVFNTRIETAGTSGMWAHALREGRCIIPAAAFFEPHMAETVPSLRTGKPVKRAYVFRAPDNAPLLFAGLQEAGCCSIITTEPNRWVSPVHNRMPLLLRFEEADDWLRTGNGPEEILAMDAYPLDVQPEHPDIEPIDEQLSLF